MSVKYRPSFLMNPLPKTSFIVLFSGFDNGLIHCIMTKMEVQWGTLARFIVNSFSTQLNSRIYGRKN